MAQFIEYPNPASGGGSSYIETGTNDPTLVATLGTIGTLYINTLTGICYRCLADGTTTSWEPMVPNSGPSSLYNLTISVGEAAGDLFINFSPNDPTTPGSPPPSFVSFRWPFADVPNYMLRNVPTQGPSLALLQGSTLGMAAATLAYLYVYAVYDELSDTVVPGVSRMFFDPGTLINTTAADASSNSNAVMYTPGSYTGAAVVLISRIAITLAVPGTWDSMPTEIAPANQFLKIPKIVARYGTSESNIIAPSTNTVIAFDTLFNDFYQTVTSGVGTFWVFTAPKAGDYRIWSKLTINNASWVSPNSIVFSVLKNGSSEAYLQQFQWGFTTNAVFSPEGSLTVRLVAGDTLSIAFYHDNASNVTTQDSSLSCYVCIEEL